MMSTGVGALCEHFHRPRLGREVVHHANPPASDVQDLDRHHAMIFEGIVVAQGGDNRRKLLQPVQYSRPDDVASVKDEIHGGEELAHFGAEV
jgi:hypothetical protein